MNEQGNGPGHRSVQELGDPFTTDSAVTPHALAPSFDADNRSVSRNGSTGSDRDLSHSDVHALQDLPFHTPEAHDPFAAFEGPPSGGEVTPIAGEATQVDDQHLIADESTSILGTTPDPVLLTVESGKDQGKKFTVLNGSTSIGRSIDNDVILTDISVSRKHLRIDLRGPELRVVDLRSGNGSLLNGSRVEESVLYHDDRIQIGESVLRVDAPHCPRPVGPEWSPPRPAFSSSVPAPSGMAAPSGPPPTVHVDPYLVQASRWTRGRVLGVVVLAGVVFTTIGAVVTAFLLGDRTSVPDDSEMEIANTFNEAQESLRRGRYREAREGFQRVVSQDPTDRSAREGLEQAATALQHERFVDEARQAASTERWSSAIELADRVPDGSRLEEEARSVARNARERWIGAVDATARAALASGDLEAARRHLREAREAAPNDPRVDRLAGDLAGAARPTDVSNREESAVSEVPASSTERRPRARASGSEAGRRTERRSDRRTGRRAESRPARVEEAAEPRAPVVSPVPVQRPARVEGADELLATARRLGSSSTAGCQAVRRVLEADSSSRPARAMFGECVSNAERLLTSASSRPATAQRHLYLQVMGMVGQSHALFARAQRALGDLRRDEDE